MTIEQIAEQILTYSETNEFHPDPVARIYSALMAVERILVKKMEAIREAERNG